MIEQPIPQSPDVGDTNLVLAAYNHKTAGTFNDLSTNAKNGTKASEPLHQRVGILLDGTDDKVDHGNVGNIQEISGWFKFTSTSEEMVLTDTGADIGAVSGTITYTTLSATATYVDNVATTTIVAGQWHFLVMQFTTEAAANFELGTDGANFGAIEVRDLRAWTTARSVSELAAEYHAGVPDTDLAAAWVARGGGLSVGDKSRYRSNMTMFGSLPFTRLGAGPFTTANYLHLSSSPYRLGDTSGTVMGWFKLDSTGVIQTLWASLNEASAGLQRLQFAVNTSDKLGINKRDSGTDEVEGGTTLVTGKWYHGAVVSTGNAWIVYLNGVAESITVLSGSNAGVWLSGVSSRTNVTIGARKQSNGVFHAFDGELSEILYSPAVRSADFIKQYVEQNRIVY